MQNIYIYSSFTFAGLIQVNLKLKCESEGTSVNITWHEPERQLTDESLRYDIRCSFCDGKHCNGTCSEEKYHPGQYNITQTFVKISDLKPGGSYVFKVYPKDSLNKKYAKEKWNFTKIKCNVIMAPGKSSMECDIQKSRFNRFNNNSASSD